MKEFDHFIFPRKIGRKKVYYLNAKKKKIIITGYTCEFDFQIKINALIKKKKATQEVFRL